MGVEAALQIALHARLAAASLGVTGVHDVAPQAENGGDKALFPYVVMGRVLMSELDVKNKVGFSALIRIHTYARGGAMLTCKTVQGAIYAALHRAELELVGFHNFSLVRESSDCWSDPDGKIHGVCEFRALIESA